MAAGNRAAWAKGTTSTNGWFLATARKRSLGQLTSYVDADGSTSSTTYDVLGRVATTNDGKGIQTWSYDGGSERRGLATSMVDSHAGTWSATYDVDGTPMVTWPNGLVARTVRISDGEPRDAEGELRSILSDFLARVLPEALRREQPLDEIVHLVFPFAIPK